MSQRTVILSSANWLEFCIQVYLISIRIWGTKRNCDKKFIYTKKEPVYSLSDTRKMFKLLNQLALFSEQMLPTKQKKRLPRNK